MKTLSLLFLLALPSVTPAQDGPKFGGCLSKETCFGPTVSVNLVAMSLKTGDLSTTFDPGIGYGGTFYSEHWYKIGASGSLAFPQFDGKRRMQPSALFSFAEYLRLGLACPLYVKGGFRENAQLLFSVGSDFGLSK